MIRTTKLGSFSLGFGHHGRRMMPADVIKSPENVIVSAHGHNGFAGDFAREILTWFSKSFGKSNHLPSTRKDTLQFEIVDALVAVQLRENSRVRLEPSGWASAV